MSKSIAIKLLSISSASLAVGVSPSCLRKYESLGLVTPLRDTTNKRLYTPEQIAALIAWRKARGRQ